MWENLTLKIPEAIFFANKSLTKNRNKNFQ